MIPASFEQSNCVFSSPPSMTDEECLPLSAFIGETVDGFNVVISCWKMTKEELEEFQRTGRIWLFVFGQTMQPVAIGCHNPFVVKDPNDNTESN